MNKISSLGLEVFPRDRYEVASEIPNPDAILLRSADLHGIELPPSVAAIARAGAGVNNIPIPACTAAGVVVFNTPGGNANAVKELALMALILSSRKIVDGIAWCRTLAGKDVAELVEKEKAQFEGPEILGKTLGVVGLGAIGVMIANDAIALGMHVTGYDPFISVEAAWRLSQRVQRAETLESLLAKSDYVSLHLPLGPDTKGIIDGEKLCMMKKGARLLNLARGGLVKDADVVAALEAGRLSAYVTDFPNEELLACRKVICIPHLGASTPEAEDNCAVMAAKQLRDFLETGEINNSVNYPRCHLERKAEHRLVVANRNIPNMVGQITTILAGAKINIMDLVNHHRDEYAYNIIDTAQDVPEEVLSSIRHIEGVIRARPL
jgi:D-3-phosphoglycerate dehydrogenase